jgi:hypothetical protein
VWVVVVVVVVVASGAIVVEAAGAVVMVDESVVVVLLVSPLLQAVSVQATSANARIGLIIKMDFGGQLA